MGRREYSLSCIYRVWPSQFLRCIFECLYIYYLVMYEQKISYIYFNIYIEMNLIRFDTAVIYILYISEKIWSMFVKFGKKERGT